MLGEADGATAWQLGVQLVSSWLVCQLPPRAALTVRDTWFTAGMRATASNTFASEDVLVPQHRVLPIRALTEGGGPATSGQEGLYLSPFNPVGVPALLAPLLGVSRAALAWAIKQAGREGTTPTTYSHVAPQLLETISILLNVHGAVTLLL